MANTSHSTRSQQHPRPLDSRNAKGDNATDGAPIHLYPTRRGDVTRSNHKSQPTPPPAIRKWHKQKRDADTYKWANAWLPLLHHCFERSGTPLCIRIICIAMASQYKHTAINNQCARGIVHGMIVVFRGGGEVLLIGCGIILCVGGMWM
jgi:hypothetical protein